MKVCVSALLLATSGGKKKAGVGRHMIQVIDRLAQVDLGHQYDIFVPQSAELPPEWTASPWVTWHPIPTESAKTRILWEHWKLAGEAKRLGADVFFSAFIQLPILPTPPAVCVIHDAFPRTHGQWFPPRNRLILDTMTAQAASKSKRIITVSEWSKQQIHQAYGAPLEKIIVAPNGPGNPIVRLSNEDLSKFNLREFIDSDRPYLFTLSTLEPRKNLLGLLEGFAQLREKFPEHLLVVAGARGWMESDVFQKVDQLGLQDHVKFLGYVPDEAINAIMQKADLFVLASMVEGFGIPVLEAMMAGTAVACSNTSAIPEVAGEDAFYFDPTDPSSIAKGISEGLSDPIRRQDFSERGLKRAKQFTWDAVLQKVNQAFIESK